MWWKEKIQTLCKLVQVCVSKGKVLRHPPAFRRWYLRAWDCGGAGVRVRRISFASIFLCMVLYQLVTTKSSTFVLWKTKKILKGFFLLFLFLLSKVFCLELKSINFGTIYWWIPGWILWQNCITLGKLLRLSVHFLYL